MSEEKIEHFAYVPHSRQRQFESLGWEYHNDLGPPHSSYASLFIWMGEGEPVYPTADIHILKPVKPRSEGE